MTAGHQLPAWSFPNADQRRAPLVEATALEQLLVLRGRRRVPSERVAAPAHHRPAARHLVLEAHGLAAHTPRRSENSEATTDGDGACRAEGRRKSRTTPQEARAQARAARLMSCQHVSRKSGSRRNASVPPRFSSLRKMRSSSGGGSDALSRNSGLVGRPATSRTSSLSSAKRSDSGMPSCRRKPGCGRDGSTKPMSRANCESSFAGP